MDEHDIYSQLADFGFRLPKPLRNDAAAQVALAYQRAYLEAYPGELDFQKFTQFWQTPSTEAALLRHKAREAPVESYQQASFDLSKNYFSQAERGDFARGLTALREAQTVGDLENVLMQAVAPGLNQYAARLARNGQDPGELVGQMYLGVLERTPSYNPTYTDPQGQQRSADYGSYVMAQAHAYARSMGREAQKAAPAGALSLEGNTWIEQLAGLRDQLVEGEADTSGSIPDVYLYAQTPGEIGRFQRYQGAARLPAHVPVSLFTSSEQPAYSTGGQHNYAGIFGQEGLRTFSPTPLKGNNMQVALSRAEIIALTGSAPPETLEAMAAADPSLGALIRQEGVQDSSQLAALRKAAGAALNNYTNLPNWAGGEQANPEILEWEAGAYDINAERLAASPERYGPDVWGYRPSRVREMTHALRKGKVIARQIAEQYTFREPLGEPDATGAYSGRAVYHKNIANSQLANLMAEGDIGELGLAGPLRSRRGSPPLALPYQEGRVPERQAALDWLFHKDFAEGYGGERYYHFGMEPESEYATSAMQVVQEQTMRELAAARLAGGAADPALSAMAQNLSTINRLGNYLDAARRDPTAAKQMDIEYAAGSAALRRLRAPEAKPSPEAQRLAVEMGLGSDQTPPPPPNFEAPVGEPPEAPPPWDEAPPPDFPDEPPPWEADPGWTPWDDDLPAAKQVASAAAVTPRQLQNIPLPSNPKMPVLPKQAAFQKSAGRGIHRIGNYSYVRSPETGEYLSIEQYQAKYGRDPMQLNRWAIDTFEGASFHEFGHDVWYKLPAEVRKTFEQAYNRNLKADRGSLLAGEWDKSGKLSAREEWAQAYSAFGMRGLEGLRETHPEYAEIFENNLSAIQSAESKAAPVIDLRGERPKAYKVTSGVFDAEKYPVGGQIVEMAAPEPELPPDWWERIEQEHPGDLPDLAGQPGEPQARQFRPTQENLGRMRRAMDNGGAARAMPAIDPVNGLRAYAAMINPVQAAMVEHLELGSARVLERLPAGSGDATALGLPSQVEFENLPNQLVNRGMAGAQAGWLQAVSGPLPSAGRDKLATINQRLSDYIDKYVKDFVKELEGQGVDKQAAQDTGTRVKTFMRQVAREPLRSLADALNMQEPGSTDDWMDVAYGSKSRLWNAGDLQRATSQVPALQQYINQSYGGNYGAAAGGPPTIVSSGGIPYQFGGANGSASSAQAGRGFWRGKLGQALYGSYIAKRFWSWTAGPVLQEAEQYGGYLGDLAPLAMMQSSREGQAFNLMQTDAGFASRQALTQQYFARGAWQQFGGFSDIAYSLSGSGEALPRSLAALKVGGGLTALGALAPQVVGSMFPALGGAAAAAGPIAIGAGITMLAGTAIMETRNQLAGPDAEPWTWGNLARGLTANWYEERAKQRYAQDTGRWQGGGGIGRGYAAADIAYQDYQDYLTPQQRALVEYQGEPETLKRVADLSAAVANITGEKQETVQPALRALDRALGGLDYDQTQQMASAATRLGYTTPEFTQELLTMAEQTGVGQGTPAFDRLFNQFTGLSEEELGAARREAAQVARYGGMLSPYFQDPRLANQIVQRYGLTTQPKAQAAQGLMAAAGLYGVDMDETAAYRYQKDARPVPVTWGEMVAQMSQEYGPYRSQLAAQLANRLVSFNMAPEIALGMAGLAGIQNEAGLGAANAFLGTAQQFGYSSPEGAAALTFASQAVNPYQAGLINQIAEPLMRGGLTDMGLASLASSVGAQGLSNQDMYLMAAMAKGDTAAWSWQSYQGGWIGGRFTDLAGNPIYQRDFRSFLQMGAAQFAGGNPFAGSFAPFAPSVAGVPTAVNAQSAAAWLGTGDLEAAQAWLSGGLEERTALHRERMAGYQMAGIGVGFQQLGLQRDYLWGATQGGTWDNPAANSLWGLQDQMTAMQYRQQMAGFGFSLERMDLSNRFAVEQEEGQRQRMAANWDFQRWNRGFDYAGLLMQRQWAREDWQYQDTMRGLQFGWGLEDINEAIRMSSGRERARLVRQRERMVVSNNLEGQQVETQRDRQEEVWAREDERFRKQSEYAEQLIELDQEAYELGVRQRETFYSMDRDNLERQIKDYQEQFKLQEKITKLQREHQAKQLELQEQSLGIQAAAALEQKKYQEEVEKTQKTYKNIVGSWEMMAKFSPEMAFKALSQFSMDINRLKKENLDGIKWAAQSLSNVQTSKTGALINLVNSINGLSTFKINKLIDLINMAD